MREVRSLSLTAPSAATGRLARATAAARLPSGEDHPAPQSSTNSTIVSNTAAAASHSGIYLRAGKLDIGNSIVAHNGVTNNVQVDIGTFNSLGYNLTNSGAGTPFTATTDLTNTNPLLGPLQNNGGSSWTHALLPAVRRLTTSPSARMAAVPASPPINAASHGLYQLAASAILARTKCNLLAAPKSAQA